MNGKKFRTLKLHIGLEKTGTTSIQSFLDLNRMKLARDGLFVPKSPGHVNHKLLAAYAFDAGSSDIAVTSNNVGSDPAEVEAFRARVSKHLDAEIAETDAETAVISSEDFSRLHSDAEIGRLLDLLRPYSDRIEVIVFLRRQDLLASSRYYSLIIGGSRQAQVFPPSNSKVPNYYYYDQVIERWIDAVGETNVTLVRFPENPKSETFNSVREFCKLLGIDSAEYLHVEAKHISFDAVNQIIIHNYNILRGEYDRDGMEKLMAWLKQHNDSSYRHITSMKQALSFYQNFQDGNRALFERLGAQDSMFSDDFSMYPEQNMRSQYQQVAIQRLLMHFKTS